MTAERTVPIASYPVMVGVKTKLVHPHAICPAYAMPGAAGADVCAVFDDFPARTIYKGETVVVRTGLVLEIPPGFEVQVRPRSGLAAKHGITVLNAPGTIDCDYRGEICVILINLGERPYKVSTGDRIAQLVLAPVTQGIFGVASDVSVTARGEGGFGSTGY